MPVVREEDDGPELVPWGKHPSSNLCWADAQVLEAPVEKMTPRPKYREEFGVRPRVGSNPVDEVMPQFHLDGGPLSEAGVNPNERGRGSGRKLR